MDIKRGLTTEILHFAQNGGDRHPERSEWSQQVWPD